MRVFCSICKDLFIACAEVHVTNCGHLYHAECISTWIKQHRTCPQCRAKLSQPFRVYFDVDKDNELDPATLEHKLENLSDKLRETERQKKNLENEKIQIESLVEKTKENVVSLSKKNDILKTSVKALKEQVAKLSKQNEAVTQLQNEVVEWKNEALKFKRAEALIKGSVDEVNEMIESTPITRLAVKQLCTYVGILKTQLEKVENKNSVLLKENKCLAKTAAEEKRKVFAESNEIISNLRKSKSELEMELLRLKTMFADYKQKHPDKKESTPSSNSTNPQVKTRKSTFDFDIEVLDHENSVLQSVRTVSESDKRIHYWEERVCAGPSRNLNFSVKGSYSSCNGRLNCTSTTSTHDNVVSRSSSVYVFDGLGSRKKLRLGGPTPAEEFEKIKKKKDRKSTSSFQHKKIIDYYQGKTNGNCV